MSDPRKDARSGQVLPIVALMLTVIVCMCAMAVDLSGSYRLEASQKQRLELAKESVMSDLVALKGDDRGYAATVDDVRAALAADGFEGTYRVIVAELPKEITGEQDRLQVVRVELEQSHRSVLAQVMGVGTTTVSSALTFSINPYSSTVVHRPAATGDRESLTLTEQALGAQGATGTAKVTSLARSQLPDDVFEEANDALPHLSGCGGTDKKYERQ